MGWNGYGVTRTYTAEALKPALRRGAKTGQGHSTHVISGDQPYPFRVWSTPKNPDNHAKQIRRHIRRNS